MALLVGDVHGRVDRVRRFLKYRPEERHVFVGDYVDSFHASDMDVYETLKACIESDADLILGNHDLNYFDHPPFECSGYRRSMAKGLEDIFEAFVDRFVPALVIDGLIVTHGGVHERIGEEAGSKEAGAILRFINEQWNDYLAVRRTKRSGFTNYGPIFKIDVCRGGMDEYGGIFWADYHYERLMDAPQAFGHSKTNDGGIVCVSQSWQESCDLWALGCDSGFDLCFDSVTKNVESF